MRPDLEEIMHLFYKVSPHLTSLWIPSNGLMTSDIIKRVKHLIDDSNIRNFGISISIDGSEKYHDRVRGKKGFFNKTMKTFEKLSDLAKSNEKFSLSLGFTIGKENWQNLLFAYELSKKYDADFTTRPINFSEVYYENSGTKNIVMFSKNEQIKIQKMLNTILKDLKTRKTGLNLRNLTAYYSGILRYFNSTNKRFFPCYAGALAFSMNSHGDVFPCLYMNSKLGNIRDNTFAEIWNAQTTKEVWNQIKKKNCPNCWIECESQRNITYAVEKGIWLSTTLK